MLTIENIYFSDHDTVTFVIEKNAIYLLFHKIQYDQVVKEIWFPSFSVISIQQLTQNGCTKGYFKEINFARKCFKKNVCKS